jgi:hypothetical protein
MVHGYLLLLRCVEMPCKPSADTEFHHMNAAAEPELGEMQILPTAV